MKVALPISGNTAGTVTGGGTSVQSYDRQWRNLKAEFPQWYFQKIGSRYLACIGSHRFFLDNLHDLRAKLGSTTGFDIGTASRFAVMQLAAEEPIHLVRTDTQLSLCGLKPPTRLLREREPESRSRRRPILLEVRP